MELSLERISQQALSLPSESRAALAEKLLDSSGAGEKAWEARALICAQEAAWLIDAHWRLVMSWRMNARISEAAWMASGSGAT